jgi:hypothetical protein
MFLKFEHHDLAITEVSHHEFLIGHPSKIYLKYPIVEFKKKNLKNNMNNLI